MLSRYQLVHLDNTTEHIVEIRPGKMINQDVDKKRPKYFERDSEQWWRKGITPQRDSYKSRCYAAESLFSKQIETQVFANITEASKYIRSFMERAWFQRRFPAFKEIKITHKKRSVSCDGGPSKVSLNGDVSAGVMRITDWGLGLKHTIVGGSLLLLHEFTHAVLPWDHAHDRRWLRTYIEFIGCMVGQTEKNIFLQILRDHKIPFSPYKKVKISAEQIQRLNDVRPNNKKEVHEGIQG